MNCPTCRRLAAQMHPYHVAAVTDEDLMNRARRLATLPPGERGPAMEALARSYGVTRRTLQRYLAK